MSRRELSIQQGMPLPATLGRPRTIAGETARKMKPGDSAFTDSKSEADTMRCAIYELGGKAAIRKRVEDGVPGFRVWRMA